MERKLIPEAETRLTLLFALRELGPVSSPQLLEFMVTLDVMNYFELQLNLLAMEDQGQVAEEAHPSGSLFCITPAGEYALNAFRHRIPYSTRELIQQHAEEWRNRFRLEQQTLTDLFQRADGAWCARLRLLDNTRPMLDLLLILEEKQLSGNLRDRWRSHAAEVYRSVMGSLTSGGSEPLPEEIPEQTAISQMGEDSWLVCLDSPGWTLMMTVADEETAKLSAYRWKKKQAALRRRILRILELTA